MRNTFLIETLKWLKPDEILELELFIDAKFHNGSNLRMDVIRLFDYLKDAYPDFDEVVITKKRVYENVFPGLPEIASKLEKVTSELYRLVKEYLLWKNYQKPSNQFNKSLDWVKVLKALSVNDKIEPAVQRIEKDFFLEKPMSAFLFFQRFQLEYEKHEWMNLMNKSRNDINLNNTINSLCAFFEIFRLELLNLLLLQQKVTYFKIPDLIQKNIETKLIFVPNDDNIILHFSRKIHELLQQKEPEYEAFEELLDELKNKESMIVPQTLKTYYAYLRNICTLMLNIGHKEMRLVLIIHRLQKDNLERGYLYYEGKLHTTTLGSITKIAVMAGNVDWALEVIETHKERMFGDIETDDYYSINKAICLFEKGAFEQALELIPPVSSNIVYHLIARRLEIMCYYELNSELLLYKIEAFKVYIWRASEKPLSESLSSTNKSFINLLLQLVAIPKGDKAKFARLEKRIIEKGEVAESRWLLSKVRV